MHSSAKCSALDGDDVKVCWGQLGQREKSERLVGDSLDADGGVTVVCYVFRLICDAAS